MTNDKTVTMSRELVNDLLYSARLEIDDRIRSLGEEYRPHVLAALRKVVADAEAILAAPVVERKPDAIIEGVMTSCGISHAIYASTVSLKHGEQVKLYAAPSAPPLPDAAKAFAKGFNTLEAVDGKYKIVMQFAERDDAWAAYTALSKLTASLAKPQ